MPSETSGPRVNLMGVHKFNGRCWATQCASERGRNCMALEPCLKDGTRTPVNFEVVSSDIRDMCLETYI